VSQGARGQANQRPWHRLFGLLRTDFFSGSPFVVEVERDLLVQQLIEEFRRLVEQRQAAPGTSPDGLR
jgi:hypothetical protein